MKRKRLRHGSKSEAEAPKAKKNVVMPVESGHDEDEDDLKEVVISLEGSVAHDSIPVTFEFRDMRHEYSESIRLLLRNMVLNPSLAYEAACIITAQAAVGTVVCCEDESDVFAFATIIPMAVHQQQVRLHSPLSFILHTLAEQCAFQHSFRSESIR